MVVLFHCTLAFYPSIPSGGQGFGSWVAGTPLLTPINGSFAVSIFYVLSGFVLSLAFFKTQRRRVAIVGLLKRYSRLAIPIAITTTLYYLLMVSGQIIPKRNWVLGVQTHSYWLASQYQFPAELNTLLSDSFWLSLIEGQSRYNPVLWTMKYEFFGSCLIFATLMLFGKSAWRGWAFALVSLAVLLFLPEYLGFMLGLMAADWFMQGKRFDGPERQLRIAWPILLIVGTLYFGSVPYYLVPDALGNTSFGWLQHTVYYKSEHAMSLLLTLGSVCVMLLVLSKPVLQRILSSPACQFLGKISFGLYLTHIAVLFTMTLTLFDYLVTQMSLELAALVSIAVSLPFMISVGFLAYKAADMPGIVVSHRIGKQLEKWLRLPEKA
jgi:peptidoglycan/LPS O-acetylase OafA/YrhL